MKKVSDSLYIINYVVDEESAVLSHQIEAVRNLAPHFKSVLVLTGKVGKITSLPRNVQVVNTNWVPNQNVRNVIRFYTFFLQSYNFEDRPVIFSHMTALQSALIAPLMKILRIRHFLWYAHKKNNTYLRFCTLFVNGFITSTSGSFPAKTRNLFVIGQAIDQDQFKARNLPISGLSKFVHIGRMDPIKNVPEIIEVLSKIHAKNDLITFTQIGSPTDPRFNFKSQYPLMQMHPFEKLRWLSFQENLKRSEVPKCLLKYDIFIHAFRGSLDKSLVEATFTRMPVVTVNLEYLSIFGSWSKNSNTEVTLETEVSALLGLTNDQISKECERRSVIALAGHSLENWTISLVDILKANQQLM